MAPWTVSQWRQGLCLDIQATKIFILALACDVLVSYLHTFIHTVPLTWKFCLFSVTTNASESSCAFSKLILPVEMPRPNPPSRKDALPTIREWGLQTASRCGVHLVSLSYKKGLHPRSHLPRTVSIS